MQGQSPNSKMRLSLEEDILNGQGDEWDDILTPSVVHNAESIAQKIDFKDPRQLDFSGIDLHGGNKHLDQNKSGIPLEDEQPETQRVQTIQKEKEESLDSQRTYHVQVYDDQHQIQYAKDDIDMSQEKGQILTKRDRSMPVNDNNDGETIDQFNKMLNESPFSYRRYMRQQDSNSRKAINEQYNSQVANDIIQNKQGCLLSQNFKNQFQIIFNIYIQMLLEILFTNFIIFIYYFKFKIFFSQFQASKYLTTFRQIRVGWIPLNSAFVNPIKSQVQPQ